VILLPWSEGKIDVAVPLIRYRDRWIFPSMKAFTEVMKEVISPACKDRIPAAAESHKIPSKTVGKMRVATAAKKAIEPVRKQEGSVLRQKY
jgi:hypothetical protein